MVNPSSLKFESDPEFPHCDFALLRGDPEKGPSVMLNKSTGDCLVPMHWHSYGEAVTMVSGTGEIATSDGKHIWLKAGGYFFQPPHVAALGRFPKNSMFFTSFDGPIDMHFVDDMGQEISHDVAFARARTRPHKHR